MQKIVTWILAVLTAMFNNLGFWQQPDRVYTGDSGYSITEDAVDYTVLQKDYYNAFSNASGVCKIEAKSHLGETNLAGIGYIVAGAPYNPDAQLKFSDGAVIIAPNACRITTQPDSSSNLIVVVGDGTGPEKFKMEISKPKKWFCCEDLEADASGLYRHAQGDHRISLKQGDTICVASIETEITLYRGDATGALKKCETLREFLRSTSGEDGDTTQIASGGNTQIKQSELSSGVRNNLVSIDTNKLFKGPAVWVQDTDGRWWYGRSGNAGVDWASDQWVIYEGYYYYFDATGYMVTGWNGNYYYQPSATAYEDGTSDFKQGALCFDTIAPSPDGHDFVYLGMNGEIKEEGKLIANNIPTNVTAEGINYRYVSGSGKYVATSDITSKSEVSESVDSENNNGGYSIVTCKAEIKKLTDTEWNYVSQYNKLENAGFTGWCSHNGNWYWFNCGELYTEEVAEKVKAVTYLYSGAQSAQLYTTGYTVNGRDCYLLMNSLDTVTGNGSTSAALSLFDSETNALVVGNYSGTQCVYATSSYGQKYIVNPSGYLVQSSWWRDESGHWLYATTPGNLMGGGTESNYYLSLPRRVVMKDGANDKLYYAFDGNYFLDVKHVEVLAQTGSTIYKLAPELNIEGARIAN